MGDALNDYPQSRFLFRGCLGGCVNCPKCPFLFRGCVKYHQLFPNSVAILTRSPVMGCPKLVDTAISQREKSKLPFRVNTGRILTPRPFFGLVSHSRGCEGVIPSQSTFVEARRSYIDFVCFKIRFKLTEVCELTIFRWPLQILFFKPF